MNEEGCCLLHFQIYRISESEGLGYTPNRFSSTNSNSREEMGNGNHQFCKYVSEDNKAT
jgi:hypothetical protein